MLAAFFITAAVALGLEFAVKQLVRGGVLTSASGRKAMHVAMGPVFMLCCARLFPLDNFYARHVAALIPLTMTLKFALIGFGVITDATTTRSMSRSGNPRELLFGPVQYGAVFVVSTILHWQSAAGVVTLMTLCFGDAAAEIFGSRWGHDLVPWADGNSKKTVVGTVAFVVASVASIVVMLSILAIPAVPLPLVVGVAVVTAFAESRCEPNTDNVVIFLAAQVACFAFELV